MNKIRICFDIGHGRNTYSEFGSKGIDGFAEWEFNNAVVKYAKPLAEYNGFEVILTQPLDSNEVSLKERIKFINAEHKKKPIELLMSFHADYNDNKNAQGHWCFHWHTSTKGKRLAEIWIKYANEIMQNPNRGVQKSIPKTWTDFAINRETLMPTALMEHAFYSNEDELELLKSEDFRKKCAIAAVKTACEFCGIEYKEEKKEEVKVTLPTLKIGSKGEEVKLLQQKLKDLGYNVGVVDGDFGNKTLLAVKEFQKNNNLVVDGIVGKNTWNALETAKPIVKDTPIRKYEIIKTKDGINIVKIKKEHLKKIDVILCKQPKETLSSVHNRLNPKPSFLLNGGLFALNNGNSMSTMYDEGKKIVDGYFSDYGFYVKNDSSFGFGNYKQLTNLRDFMGASPSLIIDGKINIDLKGLTNDKNFTDYRHPRTCLGMDDNYLYLIVVDGRQTGKTGMTIKELANFGMKLGLKYFINLDGGGSSRLLGQDGRAINSPTENRAVDNCIAFYL